MTVFKAYMKITKRNTGLILMYLVIFMAITFLFQSATKDQNGMYSAESVKIGLVDEDGGVLARGLEKYLEKYHQITPMENNKNTLQENLFYRNIEYIVKIPADFEELCLKNNEKLSVTKLPGSYTSFYVDQQINSFLNNVKTYYAAGYSTEEAVDSIMAKQEPEVNMLDFNGNAGEIPGYNYYFAYLPYLMLSVLCYVLGNILSAFHKGDIPKRMQASAISGRRQNMEALLAAGILGIGLWGITVAAGILIFGKALIQSSGFGFYLLNSFAMLLVALSLSYLVGMFTNSANALSGIVNIISLGMCFLCGVFVPLDIMSKGVKTVAQFLPVFWYETANVKIAQVGNITDSIRHELLQYIGIQMVFAVAFICITMVFAKKRQLGK